MNRENFGVAMARLRLRVVRPWLKSS